MNTLNTLFELETQLGKTKRILIRAHEEPWNYSLWGDMVERHLRTTENIIANTLYHDVIQPLRSRWRRLMSREDGSEQVNDLIVETQQIIDGLFESVEGDAKEGLQEEFLQKIEEIERLTKVRSATELKEAYEKFRELQKFLSKQSPEKSFPLESVLIEHENIFLQWRKFYLENLLPGDEIILDLGQIKGLVASIRHAELIEDIHQMSISLSIAFTNIREKFHKPTPSPNRPLALAG